MACPPKVRSALVKGLDVKPEQVSIDYDTKLIAIDLGGQELDVAKVNACLKEDGYSVAP